jgi:hypothetical protein
MRWPSSTPAEDRPRPIRESDRKDQDKIMTSHTVIVPLVVAAVSRRCGGYLAATSLTFLKPRFKRFLMPVSARLARAGVVANQVTTVSIVGSLIMGGLLSLFHSHSILFGLLPVWVLVRMGCATIDGTLAIDFGQKSRLGGVLNEVGDVVSDVVLFLPLAFVVLSQYLPSGRSLCSQFRAKSRACSVPRSAARDGWMAQWARLTVDSRWEYWAFGSVVVGRSHPKRLGPRCRLDACSRSRPPIGCISRGPRGSGPTDDAWLLGSRIAPSAAVAPQRRH